MPRYWYFMIPGNSRIKIDNFSRIPSNLKYYLNNSFSRIDAR